MELMEIILFIQIKSFDSQDNFVKIQERLIMRIELNLWI